MQKSAALFHSQEERGVCRVCLFLFYVLVEKALQTGLLLCRTHGLAHGRAEGPQGLLLLGIQVHRYLHLHGDVLVAPATALEGGDTLALQAEGGPGLGPGGQVPLHLAVNGGDLQFRAHGRLVEGHRLLIQHGTPVPLEDGAGLDADAHDQIAGGTAVLTRVALAPDGDRLALVDAGGDVHLDAALFACHARAAAALAGAVDDLTRAPAPLAGGRAGKGKAAAAPLDAYHTGTPAVGAHLRRGPGLTAGAVAVLALLRAAKLDLLLAAKGGLLKGDGQVGPQALPPLGGAGPLLAAEAAPAKATAEEGPEQVAQVDVSHIEPTAAIAAGTKVGVHSRMAELVILGPLVLVGQDLIGLVHLFELGLGLLVPGVHVRVIFLGQLAVGLL